MACDCQDQCNCVIVGDDATTSVGGSGSVADPYIVSMIGATAPSYDAWRDVLQVEAKLDLTAEPGEFVMISQPNNSQGQPEGGELGSSTTNYLGIFYVDPDHYRSIPTNDVEFRLVTQVLTQGVFSDARAEVRVRPVTTISSGNITVSGASVGGAVLNGGVALTDDQMYAEEVPLTLTAPGFYIITNEWLDTQVVSSLALAMHRLQVREQLP